MDYLWLSIVLFFYPTNLVKTTWKKDVVGKNSTTYIAEGVMLAITRASVVILPHWTRRGRNFPSTQMVTVTPPTIKATRVHRPLDASFTLLQISLCLYITHTTISYPVLSRALEISHAPRFPPFHLLSFFVCLFPVPTTR